MTTNQRQNIYWEHEDFYRRYNHPVVRFFAQQRLQYINQILDLSQLRNVLDVGCGNGFSTFYLQEYIADILAVDRSYAMLRKHPLTNKVIRADAQLLPFASNSFDLVNGWEILHHVEQPQYVVKEMARVSQRYVLIAEPNRNNIAQAAFALWDREHRWVLRYSLSFLRHLFTYAELEVVYAGNGGWIFPNVTPSWLLPILAQLPYRFPLGISNWILGHKR